MTTAATMPMKMSTGRPMTMVTNVLMRGSTSIVKGSCHDPDYHFLSSTHSLISDSYSVTHIPVQLIKPRITLLGLTHS
jgi:hypothetical protein